MVHKPVPVIGDEILKGHVQDTNSHFLCKELWALGVKVCRTVVVADDIQAIAAEVEVLSPLYDFILTSGGVGPTHDDITMEGGSQLKKETELDLVKGR